MKKIKHKPDFEPFALVIETEEERKDLSDLIEFSLVNAVTRDCESRTQEFLNKLDGPYDE